MLFINQQCYFVVLPSISRSGFFPHGFQFTRRPSKRHSRRGRIDTLASTQSPHQEGQIQSAAVNIRTLASPAAGMQPSASVVANNPRLINEMMLANGSLKRQNYLNQK